MLIDRYEAAEIVGVSHVRIHILAKNGKFPKPVGKIDWITKDNRGYKKEGWLESDVIKWVDNRDQIKRDKVESRRSAEERKRQEKIMRSAELHITAFKLFNLLLTSNK